MRGQAADYDHWRQLGIPAGAGTTFSPYFVRSDRREHATDELHGKQRRMAGRGRLRLSWRVLDLFRDAAVETGIPATPDFKPAATMRGWAISRSSSSAARRWSRRQRFPEACPRAQQPDAVDRGPGPPPHRRGVTYRRHRDQPPGRGQGPSAPAARSSCRPARVNSPHLLQPLGIGDPALLGTRGIAVAHGLSRRRREPAGPICSCG